MSERSFQGNYHVARRTCKTFMSFKDIADGAKELEDKLDLTIDDVLNKLTQELGEFNDAVQKYRGIYSKIKTKNTDDVESEVGDLVFNLISICNRLGINPDKLEEYAEKTLEKGRERLDLYKEVQRD